LVRGAFMTPNVSRLIAAPCARIEKMKEDGP